MLTCHHDYFLCLFHITKKINRQEYLKNLQISLKIYSILTPKNINFGGIVLILRKKAERLVMFYSFSYYKDG